MYIKTQTISEITPTRRSFILGSVAAGSALAVGFSTKFTNAQDANVLNPLETYVRIGADNKVTILSAHFDMGQGSYHGIATLVVEELGCDWDQVDVVGAYGNTKAYGNLPWGGFAQVTGGSTAMASSWDRYRMAGAAARMMLVSAAAIEWRVPESEITVSKGMLQHSASGRSEPFGIFTESAANITVPTVIDLKSPEQWSEIGNSSVKRYDSAGKTTGEQKFTIDVHLENMLTAVPIHPPKFGAQLKSFDATAAKAMDGVVDVVAMPRGLSVVAKDTWTAIKARELVTAQWDESQAETRSSLEIQTLYKELSKQTPAATARNDGNVASAMNSAAQLIEATYTFPFLAHVPLEPINAVVNRTDDGIVEVWGGLQGPDGAQNGVARAMGIPPENIHLHVMKSGGGFGRRGTPDGDVVTEAVGTAYAIKWQAPLKMQWTRENDVKGGRYRPAYVHRIRAGLDKDGNIIAWDHHIVGQSIMTGTPMEAGLVHGGVDVTSVEGASTLPYKISNLNVGLTTTDVKVPVLWWRSVGHTHTAYSTETFLDEIAVATNQDPVELRLSLLDPKSRHAGVLTKVAEISNWMQGAESGRFRGVAVHESFGSVVAEVAEISVDAQGVLKVHKVWCAVNCGVAINPDTIKAQVEGSVGFGLGAILAEEITLTNGEVDQSNYDAYTPLRIDQMPEIEVAIITSENRPTGIGEPAVPPIGPAVANAYRLATGKSVRKLPFATSI